MAAYYPAFLDLRGRRCLVVGGGTIAERKVTGLLEAGARVRVVSPTLTPALSALARTSAVEHRPRTFRRHDARGCALVVAATGLVMVDDVVAAAKFEHRGARSGGVALLQPLVDRALDRARDHSAVEIETGRHEPNPPHTVTGSFTVRPLKDWLSRRRI